MEHLWNLMKAEFFLVTAIILLLFAYLFENTVIAIIGIYAAIFLFFIGIGIGLFALIDHKNEVNNEEDKE